MYLEMVVAWVALGALEFWKFYGEALRVIKPNQMKYHWLRQDFFCNYRSGHDKTQKMSSKYNIGHQIPKCIVKIHYTIATMFLSLLVFHTIRLLLTSRTWNTHLALPLQNTHPPLPPWRPWTSRAKTTCEFVVATSGRKSKYKGTLFRAGEGWPDGWDVMEVFHLFFVFVLLGWLGCNKSQFKVWSGEVMIGWMGWMIFFGWFNLNLLNKLCFSSSLNHFYPELCLHHTCPMNCPHGLSPSHRLGDCSGRLH